MASRACHYQGLKPHSFPGTARLKPCPDTNQIITSCSRKCRNSSRRLKAGGSQDWLPHSQVHPRYSACRRPLAKDFLFQASGVEFGGAVDLAGFAGARETVHAEDARLEIGGQQERIQEAGPAVVERDDVLALVVGEDRLGLAGIVAAELFI